MDAQRLLLEILDKLDLPADSILRSQDLLDVLPDEGFEEEELELWRRMAHAQRRLLRFDEAALSYEEVLKKAPEDLLALRVLTEHHTNGMNWNLASDFARRALAVEPDSPKKASQWEALGDLLRLQAKESAQVEEAYRKALQLQPSLFTARWKLWQILRSSGDWHALRELGPELLEAGLEKAHEAEVHRVMGRALLMTEGENDQALHHFEQALLLGVADRAFVEETSELAHMLGRWELYTALAGQILEQSQDEDLDPEVTMEGYLRLAQVFQDELSDVERAAACVRRALELHPRDQELLRRLGTLYASNFDTYREAIEVFRELQGMDPVDPDVLRYLARLEAARGEMDRSACYYAGLKFLLPMDPEAKRLLDHLGPSREAARPLQRSEWDRIVLHPKADCLLQRVFSALAPYLERLFPTNLSRFKLMDTVPDQVGHAAEQARVLLSGRPFDLKLVDESVYRAWLESGSKPTILLSKVVFEKGSEAEHSFFVARQVIRVAMGGVLTEKFSRTDLQQLLAILAKMVQPEHEPVVPLPPTASQYMEAIERVVPADELELIVPAMRRYALEPRAHDLDAWLQGVQRTADRAALLCCGDLNAALAVMTRFSEAAGGRDLAFIPDRASLVTRDQEMLALMRFAYTEPYFQLRKDLDLVVR